MTCSAVLTFFKVNYSVIACTIHMLHVYILVILYGNSYAEYGKAKHKKKNNLKRKIQPCKIRIFLLLIGILLHPVKFLTLTYVGATLQWEMCL